MNKIKIGLTSDFPVLPAEVELEQHPYYLTAQDDGYRLVSRVCPHAGYEVRDCGDQFICPLHGWSFDAETLACLQVRGAQLRAYPVQEEEGALYTTLQSV